MELSTYELLRRNDIALSRTARTGTLDTSASAEKLAPNCEASSAQALADENRRIAARYIVWRGSTAATEEELRHCLVVLSELVNCQLSLNGLFRSWSIEKRQYGEERHVPPGDVSGGVRELDVPSKGTMDNASTERKLAVIAALEWEVGIGPLHPFSDGCGRTARYFAALLSIVYRCPAVLHTDRVTYYHRGAAGKDDFTQYYGDLALATQAN